MTTMGLLQKTGIILGGIFAIRLIVSCGCHCPIEKIAFDFNTMHAYAPGSGNFESVPMLQDSRKVSFGIAVEDTVNMYYTEDTASIDYTAYAAPLGFSSAMAIDCFCSSYYAPNQKIRKITITSLLPLNAQIPAMSDVSELFVASRAGTATKGNLYLSMPELYKAVNPELYVDTKTELFTVFLTVPVEHTAAQFAVEVELTDNRTLRDTTGLITIIQ